MSGRRENTKKMMIIMTIMLFLEMILSNDIKVPREEKRREKYYKRIIEESLPDSMNIEIELKYDQEGFYLSNIRDTNEKQTLAVIKKENVISGCEFFPFRDYISGLIVNYSSTNPYVNREVAVPLFTIVYQMLYLRFGNKERSYKFYARRLKQEQKNEFYNFDLKDEKKEYMLNILTKSKSQFYMKEEDIKLAKSLGLNTVNYDMAMELFEYVMNYTLQMKDLEYRDVILPIVNNKEFFKKYVDYVYIHGIHIKVKDYSNIYQNQFRQDYFEFNKIIKDKFKFENEICIMIMPLHDLLRQYEQDEDSKEIMDLKIGLKSEFGFTFAFDKNLDANSKLGYTLFENHRSPARENLYLEYGYLNHTKIVNKTILPFPIKKSDFSFRKADFCKKFGCGGFNIDYLMHSRIPEFKENFFIDKNINLNLLNILKLIHIDEKKLIDYVHVPKFRNFSKFDNLYEMKALNTYINNLRKYDQDTLEYVTK